MNLELFGCAGGMADGFRRAGIAFHWVFDKDPNAVESYTRNLGHKPAQMDVRDLLSMVVGGWRPGSPPDLLVADPPCTPWSRAGKRKGVEDERDMLAETVEIILKLRPAAYLIGNVPGLQDETQWHHIQAALHPLRHAGYCIADYAQLDAANYGVPQHRIRPFWFGHLAGPCLRWPEPTHGPATGQACIPGTELKPWVTCRAALKRLPLEELGRPVRMRRHADHLLSAEDEPAKTVTRNTHGDGTVLISERHRPSTLDEPSKTLGAKSRGNGACALEIVEHPRHPISRLDEPAMTVKTNGGRASGAGAMMRLPQGQRVGRVDKPGDTVTARTSRVGAGSGQVLEWPWNRPATTIQADERLASPGHHDKHWKDGNGERSRSAVNAIVLSERAAAILQGFPPDWYFVGATKRARWSQIGQAMPPPLAEAVARRIRKQMEANGQGA